MPLDPQIASLARLLVTMAKLPARNTAMEAEIRALRAKVTALRQALPPTLLLLPEAAKVPRLSISMLRHRVKRGDVPAPRVGRAVRTDVAVLRPAKETEVVRLAAVARLTAGLPCLWRYLP